MSENLAYCFHCHGLGYDQGECPECRSRASDATPADERDDTIDGLRSDLEAAVEVAYKRGATEWVRLNYPDQFKKLSAASPAPVPGDLVDGRGLLSDVPEMDLVEWLRWYGFGRCPEAADRIEWLQMRVAVLESEIQQTVQILNGRAETLRSYVRDAGQLPGNGQSVGDPLCC